MNPSSNLYLIGPMGAGKSALGRRLARRLGMAALDLDERIEAEAGADIARIFECEGEAGFRRRESRALQQTAALQGIVLACGGGVVLDAANRALLREHGFVVYLEVDLDTQLLRLAHDGSRPLLAVPDRRARLAALARVRNPLYRDSADLCFRPGPGPCEDNAERLAAELAERWQRLPSQVGA